MKNIGNNIIITTISIKDGRLCHGLQIDSHDYMVETELSDNVIEYAVTDRIDSIVMGLLMFAIRNGYDFVSELPITDSLLYNIQNHFINAIVGDSNLHKVTITCPTCPKLQQKGDIVSTGVSCGVDSLYTILQHRSENVPNDHRLTHLTFMDIGSHHNHAGKSTPPLYNERKKHIVQYCKEINIPLIEIKSNLPDIINEIDPNKYSHLNYHSFMALFAILNIAAGVSRYYYSSGYSYREFTCIYPEHGDIGASAFDLLTMYVASYGSTHFSPFGGDRTRVEKVKLIAEHPHDASFLDVCIDSATNCGKCFKCRRTLLEIDAIGKLDVFTTAFNIDKYIKDKSDILAWLYVQHLNGDSFAEEIMPYFKFSFMFKVKTIIKRIYWVIKNKIYILVKK